MKKSLSVILTSAMALSMFSSVAFGKTSADFTDLKDLDAATKAKFDAMISAGIFDGVSEDTFGLKEEMNRAQFAKVAALLLGLKADATTSSFSDVKADDAANGYALPYIEALKTAGVTDGYGEGTYNPAGKVTKEQLATFLVRVLGKDADAKAKTGTDTTVSDWAQGYVALALELKLLANGEDGKFGGQANATRDLLLTGAYEAKQQYVPAGAVSLTEAKATGVYKVLVTFNKPVDTEKAVLTIKKGSNTVSTSTTTKPVWSEDKKSVTLTTDTRIGAGDYAVTLSGLDAATVDKTTASFTAEDEKVTKIDFVNADDTIAYSASATIEVKASNQYGEAVSIGAGDFTALVSGSAPTTFKKNDAGNFVITANVKGIAGVTQGQGVIPVTVYYNNSAVTVSKNFKVGTVPLLTKIESGEVTYSNNSTKLSAQNDVASVALSYIDQYGNKISKAQFDSNEVLSTNINPVVTPYEANLEVVKAGATLAPADLFDETDNGRIQVKLTNKVDKNADFTLNIFGGVSSTTAKISVGAANLATKIEFDTSAVVLSADKSSIVVPVVAYDANGNKLTAQDIADNAAAGRFNFTATNASTATPPAIVQTGADKGKLSITFNVTATAGIYNTLGSKVFISGQINQSQTNTFTQGTLSVTDVRIPERIAVKTENAPKAILGASDKVVFQLKDQYGGDRADIASSIPSLNGQSAQYQVVVEVTHTGDMNGAVYAVDATPKGTIAAGVPGATPNVTVYTFSNTELDEFNKGFDLTSTDNKVGKVTVKATVQKKVGTGAWSDYSSSVYRTYEGIKSDTALTYSLNTIGSLFAAQDKLGALKAGGATPVAGETLAAYDGTVATGSQFDKKVGITAKDSAGNKVKLPLNFVKGISSSDTNVVKVGLDNITASGTGTLLDGYVIGNKAGTATVSAIVYTNKGETLNLTQEVTVKADTIVADALVADKTNRKMGDVVTTPLYAWQYFDNKPADGDATGLKITDQYGITYVNADIYKYDAVLGLRYTVKVTSGTGNVTIDAASGLISTVPSTVDEYVITAVTPNGKSVSVVVAR